MSCMFTHGLSTENLLHEVPKDNEENNKTDDLIILTTGGGEYLRIKFYSCSRVSQAWPLICTILACFLHNGVNPEPLDLNTLNCTIGVLPLTYIGVPISCRQLRKLN